ncbi:MAG: hypothetical protein IKK79_06465, partial [Spirochaetaceae bacterium]|nr:hypothetical protein [Spirochaetaceae bacterium]
MPSINKSPAILFSSLNLLPISERVKILEIVKGRVKKGDNDITMSKFNCFFKPKEGASFTVFILFTIFKEMDNKKTLQTIFIFALFALMFALI